MIEKAPKSPFWGYLIHLSYNMWADRNAPDMQAITWVGRVLAAPL